MAPVGFKRQQARDLQDREPGARFVTSYVREPTRLTTPFHGDKEERLPMTCKDAIDILADFLDHTLTSSAVEQLETHLRDCPPCHAYLNTYRKTRGLVGEAGRVEMPAELKSRLRDFLLKQLGG
jgi:anti-sigma factor (TIGR02949 family)